MAKQSKKVPKLPLPGHREPVTGGPVRGHHELPVIDERKLMPAALTDPDREKDSDDFPSDTVFTDPFIKPEDDINEEKPKDDIDPVAIKARICEKLRLDEAELDNLMDEFDPLGARKIAEKVVKSFGMKEKALQFLPLPNLLLQNGILDWTEARFLAGVVEE